MNKKIISAVLAGACAVSAMSFSVSAATAANKTVTSISQVKLSASASVASPVLNVSVPSGIAAVINPYGVKITTKDGVYDAGVSSPVYTIVNQTESSGIMVKATASLTVNTVKGKDDPNTTVNAIKIVDYNSKGLEATGDKQAAVWLDVAETPSSVKYEEYVAAKDDTPASGNAISKTDTKTGAVTWTVQIAELAGLLTDDEASFAAAKKEGEVGDIKFTDVTVLKIKDEETTTTKDDGKTYYKNSTPATVDSKVLALLPAATPDTEAGNDATFSYTQFQVAGQVGGDATAWSSSDKIALNVVLDIVPAVVE